MSIQFTATPKMVKQAVEDHSLILVSGEGEWVNPHTCEVCAAGALAVAAGASLDFITSHEISGWLNTSEAYIMGLSDGYEKISEFDEEAVNERKQEAEYLRGLTDGTEIRRVLIDGSEIA